MKSARAYTRIEPGAVFLGNAWMERSWSRFSGQTASLIHRVDGFDWLVGMSPGIQAVVQGQPVPPMTLDEVEWSEYQNPFGAGLELRQFGGDFGIISRFFAFNEYPGQFGRMEIMNRTGAPLGIDVPLEALPLWRPGIQVVTHGFVRRGEKAFWDTDEGAAAVGLAGRGLILGIAGGGRFELFEPHPERCVVRPAAAPLIAPGAGWALPETYVTMYSGALDAEGMTVHGGFLQALRALRQWERERALAEAAARAESETTTG